MPNLTTPIQSLPKTTQRVILHNVSWQTYQFLLADLGDHRSSRLAYDQGILEITMPSDLHEISKHLLERIIIALTEELNLNLRGVGSLTLDREDLQKGVEPDAGFYIQNAHLIRGRRVNLSVDPPPDLVIEVDITSFSTRRLAIYQQLKIPELWCCTEQTVQIYQLQSEEYILCEVSPTFPLVSGAIIRQVLQQVNTVDDNTAIRSFKTWLREQLQQTNP